MDYKDRIEYFKKYLLEHRDKILGQCKERYKNSREKRLKYAEEYYEKNKEKILAKSKERNEKNKSLRPIKLPKPLKEKKEKIPKVRKPKRINKLKINKEVVNKLKDVPCMDCGVKYSLPSMHFDHRDPSTKVKNVSQMLTGRIEDLLKEIAKCDVVCANCHAARTWGNTSRKLRVVKK